MPKYNTAEAIFIGTMHVVVGLDHVFFLEARATARIDAAEVGKRMCLWRWDW